MNTLPMQCNANVASTSNHDENEIILGNDRNYSCKYLCDFCGKQFMTSGGLNSHILRIHSNPKLKDVNYQDLFRMAATNLNYSAQLQLPSVIETEIQFIVENHEKDERLKKISEMFQKDWSFVEFNIDAVSVK